MRLVLRYDESQRIRHGIANGRLSRGSNATGMGGADSKSLPTDVVRDGVQHPSAEKIVYAEGDKERDPNVRDPARNAQKTGVNASTQNRGRTWTLARQKALLRTVLDDECCFFEKVSNVEKNNAWKLLLERLRGSYPDLFGGWILQRKVV